MRVRLDNQPELKFGPTPLHLLAIERDKRGKLCAVLQMPPDEPVRLYPGDLIDLYLKAKLYGD